MNLSIRLHHLTIQELIFVIVIRFKTLHVSFHVDLAKLRKD